MNNITLKELTEILSDQSLRIDRKNLSASTRKAKASSILLMMDLMVLTLSLLLAESLRAIVYSSSFHFVIAMQQVLILLPVFAFTFSIRGLYPGFGVDVISELKNLTYSSLVIYSLLIAFSYLVQDLWPYSRFVFFTSLLLTTLLLPAGRSLVRKLFAQKSWWGIPVIVVGAGHTGHQLINSLKKHVEIGLRPIVAIDDDIDRWGYIYDVPVIGGMDVIPDLSKKLKINHAIFAIPKVNSKRQREIINKYANFFEHTTVIPDLFGSPGFWVSSKDLGGIIGLEVQQNLINYSAHIFKRSFDIIVGSLLFVVSIPLYLIISLLIYIDSRGKVFFHQERMGLNNTRFEIIKFRTMHVDAEKRLNDLLESNKEMKEEYEIYHKLTNDPRLTRVGKILRKFSLDELPQFYNVLKGEMSLIGPRAYMPWERIKMSGMDEIILKVKPGISGLWQVTDRNISTFEERNFTDVYYIRNWSMFLDFYILGKTITVIITGKGE